MLTGASSFKIPLAWLVLDKGLGLSSSLDTSVQSGVQVLEDPQLCHLIPSTGLDAKRKKQSAGSTSGQRQMLKQLSHLTK